MFCNVVLSVLSSFAIISMRKSADCFNYIVSGFQCSVSLPPGAMGWSVVYDFGISWSYLFFHTKSSVF